MKPKLPKKLSPGEEAFALHCRAYGLEPVREYTFSTLRKFRFDFAWPDLKLGIEVEGGTKFGVSRHSRGDGFEEDCAKYNLAALEGWCVLRYSTGMVLNGHAIIDVRLAITRLMQVRGKEL